MITVTLERNDWGQILDALDQKYHDWQGTADCVDDDGIVTGVYEGPEMDGFIIQECNSSDEAQKIANTYQRIIGTIILQLENTHEMNEIK